MADVEHTATLFMSKTRKPILVTGSHRSGTTWVGQNLALAPHTGYIHEPFNLIIKIHTVERPFDYWFQYIGDENATDYQTRIDKVMRYEYPFFSNLSKSRTAKNVAQVFKEQASSAFHKARRDTPIMKDPLAFYSAEWLSKTYDMNVLVLIRHPAAFCSSLKLKKWQFDFKNFLNQPLLMNQYLHQYRDEIARFAKEKQSLIEQGILLWNCIYQTVTVYQQEHPEWLFVKHEDLSRDPLNQFASIFDRFNLDFTSNVQSTILKDTGAHNPAEQVPGHELRRDSKANIYNWKNRLSAEEIERIRDRTHIVSDLFYDDREW